MPKHVPMAIQPFLLLVFSKEKIGPVSNLINPLGLEITMPTITQTGLDYCL